MRACNRPVTRSHCKQQLLAPRIYYFDPLLAGPRRSWSVHLSRCRELGFSHLLSAPLFDPGHSGDVFLSSDHERLNPAITPATAVDSFIAEFARACQDHNLTLLLDIVVGRVATDSTITGLKPEWFRGDSASSWVDPRDLRRHGDAALRDSTIQLSANNSLCGGSSVSPAWPAPEPPDFDARIRVHYRRIYGGI
jgi:hypothetical protein